MARTGTVEIIARGLIEVDGSLLLCRNAKQGYLYLPGGHVEFGESAGEALARELEEEAGLRARVGGLALAAEVRFETAKGWRHEVNLVFHVEHPPTLGAGGAAIGPAREVRSLEESIGFEWVDRAAVVDVDLRPRVVKAWLAAGEDRGGGVVWVSDRQELRG